VKTIAQHPAAISSATLGPIGWIIEPGVVLLGVTISAVSRGFKKAAS